MHSLTHTDTHTCKRPGRLPSAVAIDHEALHNSLSIILVFLVPLQGRLTGGEHAVVDNILCIHFHLLCLNTAVKRRAG